jgi:hypothetical protein
VAHHSAAALTGANLPRRASDSPFAGMAGAPSWSRTRNTTHRMPSPPEPAEASPPTGPPVVVIASGPHKMLAASGIKKAEIVSLDSLHLARIGACDQKGPMINAIRVSPLALPCASVAYVNAGRYPGGRRTIVALVAAKDRRVTSLPLGVGPLKVRCRVRTGARSLKVMSGRVLQA